MKTAAKLWTGINLRISRWRKLTRTSFVDCRQSFPVRIRPSLKKLGKKKSFEIVGINIIGLAAITFLVGIIIILLWYQNSNFDLVIIPPEYSADVNRHVFVEDCKEWTIATSIDFLKNVSSPSLKAQKQKEIEYIVAVCWLFINHKLYLFIEKVTINIKKKTNAILHHTFESLTAFHRFHKEKEKVLWNVLQTSLPQDQHCKHKLRGRAFEGYENHRLFEVGGGVYIYFCSCPDSIFIENDNLISGQLRNSQNWIVRLYDINEIFYGSPVRVKKDYIHHCTDISFFDSSACKWENRTNILGVTKIYPHTVSSLNVETGELAVIAKTFSPVFSPIWSGKRLELGSNPVLITKKSLQQKRIKLKDNLTSLNAFESWMFSSFTFKNEFGQYTLFFYIFQSSFPYSVLCKSNIGISLFKKKYFNVRSVFINDGYINILVSSGKTIHRFQFEEQKIYSFMTCKTNTNNSKSWLGTVKSKKEKNKIVMKDVMWNYEQLDKSVVFNPSIIALPKTSRFSYLAIGRVVLQRGIFAMSETEKSKKVFFSSIVYCFMDTNVKCQNGGPRKVDISFSRTSVLEKINQVVGKTRLSILDKFNFYIGPEDGRLFWDQINSRLYLSYNMNAIASKRSSRVIWTVGIETFVMDYQRIVNCNCKNCDSERFKTPTELVPSFENHAVEKNWVFFNTENDAMVSYGIEPHVVLSLNKPSSLGVVSNETASAWFSSVNRTRYRIHQGTNAVPVRDMWSLSNYNKPLNMQLGHLTGNGEYSYSNFLVFTEMTYPFKIVRVLFLQKLDVLIRKHFNAKTFVYICAIDILEKECSGVLKISEPDDVLILSFGIDDQRGGALQISVETLVKLGQINLN